MNPLIPIIVIAMLVILFYFKMNNIRTKVAFFFIIFGVLFVLLFAFLVATGSSFDFSDMAKYLAETKAYFLWIKAAVVNVVEFTGRVIGVDWMENFSRR